MTVKKAINSPYRFTVEEKIEAVRRRMYQEISAEDLSREMSVRHGTLTDWIHKYAPEVLRRAGNDVPLHVVNYLNSKKMRQKKDNKTNQEQEIYRLKMELKVWEIIARMSKEHCGIDLKKNFEQMLSQKQSEETKDSADNVE